MMQKICNLIKKKRKDKKGQAIIELAFGTMLVSAMLMVVFDFALIIQTKTETMMMARNGARLLIMQGISPTNPAKNTANEKKVESHLKGLYQMYHNNSFSRSLVRLTSVEVKNPPSPMPIRDANTGKNPVYAEVCEVVSPIGKTFYGDIKICSAYTGYHSSQAK